MWRPPESQLRAQFDQWSGTDFYSPGEDENVGRPLTVVAEVVVDFGGQDQHRYPDQILKTDATG